MIFHLLLLVVVGQNWQNWHMLLGAPLCFVSTISPWSITILFGPCQLEIFYWEIPPCLGTSPDTACFVGNLTHSVRTEQSKDKDWLLTQERQCVTNTHSHKRKILCINSENYECAFKRKRVLTEISQVRWKYFVLIYFLNNPVSVDKKTLI